MTAKDFVRQTGFFTNITDVPVIIWKGCNVYKVWNEKNGKPIPTGPPFFLIEDMRGNFRYTKPEEGFEIHKYIQKSK